MNWALPLYYVTSKVKKTNTNATCRSPSSPELQTFSTFLSNTGGLIFLHHLLFFLPLLLPFISLPFSSNNPSLSQSSLSPFTHMSRSHVSCWQDDLILSVCLSGGTSDLQITSASQQPPAQQNALLPFSLMSWAQCVCMCPVCVKKGEEDTRRSQKKKITIWIQFPIISTCNLQC